jgi:hypothetical protein
MSCIAYTLLAAASLLRQIHAMAPTFVVRNKAVRGFSMGRIVKNADLSACLD